MSTTSLQWCWNRCEYRSVVVVYCIISNPIPTVKQTWFYTVYNVNSLYFRFSMVLWQTIVSLFVCKTNQWSLQKRISFPEELRTSIVVRPTRERENLSETSGKKEHFSATISPAILRRAFQELLLILYYDSTVLTPASFNSNRDKNFRRIKTITDATVLYTSDCVTFKTTARTIVLVINPPTYRYKGVRRCAWATLVPIKLERDPRRTCYTADLRNNRSVGSLGRRTAVSGR